MSRNRGNISLNTKEEKLRTREITAEDIQNAELSNCVEYDPEYEKTMEQINEWKWYYNLDVIEEVKKEIIKIGKKEIIKNLKQTFKGKINDRKRRRKNNN